MNMKAFIVNLGWRADSIVTCNVVIFSETEDDAIREAQSLHKHHQVYYAERAPWLEKPE